MCKRLQLVWHKEDKDTQNSTIQSDLPEYWYTSLITSIKSLNLGYKLKGHPRYGTVCFYSRNICEGLSFSAISLANYLYAALK